MYKGLTFNAKYDFFIKLFNAWVTHCSKTSDGPGELINGFSLGDLRSILVITKAFFSFNLS